MDLQLTKPIVFFDIEATGLDVSKDRIVEISLLKVYPDGTQEEKTFRVNPEIPIKKEAERVHGISAADLKDAPVFADIARELAATMQGCDIAGYNSNKFDIPLLAEEFLRVNVDFDIKKSRFIDVQVIFFKKEQRTLSAAYQFYCGKDLEDAHSAQADTKATYEILKAQLEHYNDLKNDVDFLAEFTVQKRFADFAGRIIYNSKKQEVFNFGKHKGKTVADVLKKDPGYYAWMMNGDFPLYTKKVLTAVKLRESFANTKL